MIFSYLFYDVAPQIVQLAEMWVWLTGTVPGVPGIIKASPLKPVSHDVFTFSGLQAFFP